MNTCVMFQLSYVLLPSGSFRSMDHMFCFVFCFFLALIVFTQQSYCIGSVVCRPFVSAGFSEPFYGYRPNFMGSYQSTLTLDQFFFFLRNFQFSHFYDLFLIFVNMGLDGSQKFQNATPPTNSRSFQSSPNFFLKYSHKVTFSDF